MNYDHWKSTELRDDHEPDGDYDGPCEDCGGTGWIVVSVHNLAQVGIGVLPDHAQGVANLRCPQGCRP